MTGRVLVARFPGWAPEDARGWEPVVRALEESITPAVDVLAPGEAAFAARGPSRYFGGDAALATKVAGTVEAVAGRPGCRVGVADGLFAATLAARAAPARGPAAAVVVAPGGSRAWLAPQPVGCLRGYEELVDLLIRLGVRTLGDLAALPVPAVLGRFGTAGAAAQLLAQGEDPRRVATRRGQPELAVSVELDPPAERVDRAAFAARGLASELHERLEETGMACGVVVIEAETEHGEVLTRRWRHEGFLSTPALAERVRWQLDGWLTSVHRPTGGIAVLRLQPEDLHSDRGRQLGFWGAEPGAEQRASRALVRVQGMLGPDAVVTAVLGGGRGLAEQVRLVPWGDDRADVSVARRKGRAEPPPPWPGRLAGPAPTVVHSGMAPAEVLDRSGGPVEVTARGALSAPPATVSVGGGSIGRRPPVSVRAWAGPWPIEERWWDRGGRRRARLQVVLDDGGAHLLSREGGRWRVEATYD